MHSPWRFSDELVPETGSALPSASEGMGTGEAEEGSGHMGTPVPRAKKCLDLQSC